MKTFYEVCGSQGDEGADVVPLGCKAVTFRRSTQAYKLMKFINQNSKSI